MKKERSRGSRRMKQVILVLCEGETEECYVDMLRQKYRLPIKVISKIVGQKIKQRLIDRHKKELRINAADKIQCYLMYDADVKKVVDTIKQCDATSLLSNPCIEIWFLAHVEKINSQIIDVNKCLQKLQMHSEWNTYIKGSLSLIQQEVLWKNRNVAKDNIVSNTESGKAFSNLSVFIDELNKQQD